ncbi:MAG: glycoside hydrolase family 75 protein [Terrimicrobiaceae bacterium]|nr:hypothetical protein [Terrimicrobiaceae bacterium]
MRPAREIRLSKILLAGFSGGLLVSLLSGCPRHIPPPPPPTPTPTPAPAATPIPSVPRKTLATAKLFNGLGLQTRLIPEKGDGLASQDRRDLDAYRVEVTVRARLPRPGTSVEDFLKNDPLLPGSFIDFESLLAGAKVSPFYEKLYELKLAQIGRELGRLDVLLARHNLYDCETILDLRNPVTGRRALLAVGDMDVNVDGSDGDRNVAVDGASQFFLPQTSYRWPKRTGRENPFLPLEQNRLASLKSELAAGTPATRKKEIEEGIDLAKRRIFDLKKWSFLISETDPFIVLPGFMMREKDNPFSPSIGDFALVLFGGKAYPAVLGDAGPSLKLGEASLLICREINARSSAAAGAVSDLKVAYLVFPGTAGEQHTPPDLEAWRARCEQYAKELGGLKCPIHSWPNLVKPWPTPTPTPTPTPEPSPVPAATASPGDIPPPGTN